MSDVSDIKAELLVLEAENEQLRRERDFYFQQVTENGERAHEAIDALNAENEKLRELLRRACNALSAFDDYVSIESIERICALARDLGIKVDE